METVFEGLHASKPEPLSFDSTIKSRAFLLQREAGNLLVYATTALADESDAIEDLGGADRQYLGHRHEASYGRSVAPVYVHVDDSDAVEQAETFAERHLVGDDFEAIPIPGHTPGSTAYLWSGGGHRVLFPGDSIMLRNEDWRAAVLQSSDRAAYLESIEVMRALDFDVLAPWAAHDGEPFFITTDRDEADRQLGAMADRVRAGEGG